MNANKIVKPFLKRSRIEPDAHKLPRCVCLVGAINTSMISTKQQVNDALTGSHPPARLGTITHNTMPQRTKSREPISFPKMTLRRNRSHKSSIFARDSITKQRLLCPSLNSQLSLLALTLHLESKQRDL